MAMPAEELQKVDPAVFTKAAVLSNAEVGVMLSAYQQQKLQDNATWTPSKVVQQTMDYAQHTSKNINEEQLKAIRLVFDHAGMLPYEYGVIANTQPANAEEAFTLVPSLKDRFSEEDMDALLGEVNMYQTF